MKYFKKIIIIVIFIVISIILLLIVNNKKNTKNETTEKTVSFDDMTNSMGSAFYARIEKVNNTNGISSLEVQGVKSLDSKIESFEGKCLVSINDNTKLYRNDTEIQISDLKSGQIVLISYSGWMSMSDPAQVNEVNKITVIEE